MVEFVELTHVVMRKGVHVHLFCSSLQFRSWVRNFGIEREQVNFYEADGAQKTIHLELCGPLFLIQLKGAEAYAEDAG